MKIIIDEKNSSWTFAPQTTLQNALIEVFKDLKKHNDNIIPDIKSIKAKNKPAEEINIDEALVEDIEEVNIITIPYDKYLLTVKEEIKNLKELVNEGKEFITSAIAQLISQNISDGMNSLKEGIERLSLFFQIIRYIKFTLKVKIDDILIEGESFPDFISNFNDILKMLLKAMENNDVTLINDYLEYELEPRLKKIFILLNELNKKLSNN